MVRVFRLYRYKSVAHRDPQVCLFLFFQNPDMNRNALFKSFGVKQEMLWLYEMVVANHRL